MGFLDNLRDPIWALLRIMTGAMFLWHGSAKLFGFPAAAPEAPAATSAKCGSLRPTPAGRAWWVPRSALSSRVLVADGDQAESWYRLRANART